MRIFRDFLEAVGSPMNIIVKYKNNRKILFALLILTLSSLLNGVLSPIIYYIFYKNEFVLKLKIQGIVLMFCICMATYLISCTAFRLMAYIFKKDITLGQIFATWGFSYIPTFICVVIVNISELTFYYFIGNTVLGLLVSTLLIMLLIWKAIFYFIELRIVLGIEGTDAVIATFLIGLIYLAIILFSLNLGLKVPML